jgi:hypothetical protein
VSRTLRKIVRLPHRKHGQLALRVTAVVFCALVVAVVAALRPGLGAVGLAAAALIAMIAGIAVQAGAKDAAKALHRRTAGRKRSAVARLVSGRASTEAAQGAAGELATYLRDRLVVGKSGPQLAIVTGVDGTELDEVVREASASLGSGVQLVAPPGDRADDIRAFAKWLTEGADEDVLPHRHAASEATLFLLGDLERYRGTGLEPGRFEAWRELESPRLALATDLRRAAASEAGPPWSNELYRKAHVLPIVEDP